MASEADSRTKSAPTAAPRGSNRLAAATLAEHSPHTCDQFVWYHDIKWDKIVPSSERDVAKGRPREGKVKLILSDGRKVEFRIDSLEQLQNVISKLENSI